VNYEHQLRDHYLTVKARISKDENRQKPVRIPARKPVEIAPEPPVFEPKEDLSDLRERIHTLSIRQVIGLCARKHGLTYDDILGHNRTRRYAAARREVAWLLYQKRTISKVVISKHMNRDHTSILYMLRKHEKIHGLGENDRTAYEIRRPEHTRADAQQASA
jgi:hypothetical protein